MARIGNKVGDHGMAHDKGTPEEIKSQDVATTNIDETRIRTSLTNNLVRFASYSGSHVSTRSSYVSGTMGGLPLGP